MLFRPVRFPAQTGWVAYKSSKGEILSFSCDNFEVCHRISRTIIVVLLLFFNYFFLFFSSRIDFALCLSHYFISSIIFLLFEIDTFEFRIFQK